MKLTLLIIVGLLVIALVAFTNVCPCGPVPGAWLMGDEPAGPVTDWSFVNDREIAPLCQVQITTWRPHSINLNCMSDSGKLYISCSNCAEKNWSNNALSYPAGYLRAGKTVYPVQLRRLTSPEELDVAWAARLAKIRQDPSPRPAHWWSFELTSR